MKAISLITVLTLISTSVAIVEKLSKFDQNNQVLDAPVGSKIYVISNDAQAILKNIELKLRVKGDVKNAWDLSQAKNADGSQAAWTTTSANEILQIKSTNTPADIQKLKGIIYVYTPAADQKDPINVFALDDKVVNVNKIGLNVFFPLYSSAPNGISSLLKNLQTDKNSEIVVYYGQPMHNDEPEKLIFDSTQFADFESASYGTMSLPLTNGFYISTAGKGASYSVTRGYQQLDQVNTLTTGNLLLTPDFPAVVGKTTKIIPFLNPGQKNVFFALKPRFNTDPTHPYVVNISVVNDWRNETLPCSSLQKYYIDMRARVSSLRIEAEGPYAIQFYTKAV